MRPPWNKHNPLKPLEMPVFSEKDFHPLKCINYFCTSRNLLFTYKMFLWLSLPIFTWQDDISDRFLARKRFICLIVRIRLKNTAYKVCFCIKITRKYLKRNSLTLAQKKEIYDFYIDSGRKKRSLIRLLIFLKNSVHKYRDK
jgi:hypothetical protein